MDTRTPFEKYLDEPFLELPENDGGRNDSHRECFKDFHIPLQLIEHVWNAAEAYGRKSEIERAVAGFEKFFRDSDELDVEYIKGSLLAQIGRIK
jgi:hypothetical protein